MRTEQRRIKKKTSRGGMFFVILGILCLLGAVGLAGYNMWDSDRAERASNDALAALIERINDFYGILDDEGVLHTRILDDMAVLSGEDMPVIEIDGYEYIGFIQFPSLDLILPVMSTWDYERLSISPCRYSGSYYTNDLVICGHNYQKHFMPVKDNLAMGDDVYFINVRAERIHYIVVNKETVGPNDVEAMIFNTNNSEDSKNEWDLTLFTCNTGGQTRAVIRCSRVEEIIE